MKISVIIPSYNRPAALGRCLESFGHQSLSPAEYEVVVVDDGSKQAIDHVIETHCKDYAVKLVRQSNKGPASARNRGVAEANGEFIAFTDDDCQVDREWLSSFVCRLQDEPQTLLGGQTLNQLTDNIYSQASQTLVDYLYEFHERTNSEMKFFTTNNMALSRQGFLDAGGFDEGFPNPGGEDREFCDRWLLSGGMTSFHPTATIYHSHPLNLTGFCKLHYRYGHGAKRFWENRTARGQKTISPEVSGFYLDLLTRPWKKNLTSPFRHSALLALSQLAGALGYFSSSESKR